MAINPVVYAELSLNFETHAQLNQVARDLRHVYRELPRAALFLAGHAFAAYKQRGGAKLNVMPDFLSAHMRPAQAARC